MIRNAPLRSTKLMEGNGRCYFKETSFRQRGKNPQKSNKHKETDKFGNKSDHGRCYPIIRSLISTFILRILRMVPYVLHTKLCKMNTEPFPRHTCQTVLIMCSVTK